MSAFCSGITVAQAAAEWKKLTATEHGNNNGIHIWDDYHMDRIIQSLRPEIIEEEEPSEKDAEVMRAMCNNYGVQARHITDCEFPHNAVTVEHALGHFAATGRVIHAVNTPLAIEMDKAVFIEHLERGYQQHSDAGMAAWHTNTSPCTDD